MRLIDADALEKKSFKMHGYGNGKFVALGNIRTSPTIDAVPVTASELKHLINDAIAYIWRMEELGLDKPGYGYESRKDLLEKLKQFEKEHFPEMDCACVERKDGEGLWLNTPTEKSNLLN